MLTTINENCENIILNVLKKKSLINTISLISKLREDLQFDSIDFFDVIIEIEHIFCIELYDDDIYNIVTIDDLVKSVKGKI